MKQNIKLYHYATQDHPKAIAKENRILERKNKNR
jgi:hypothetical protein